MCTKMLILWTILVLGSRLQITYAEEIASASNFTGSTTAQSQQSDATTITITTTGSVTTESPTTTPATSVQTTEISQTSQTAGNSDIKPTSTEQSTSPTKKGITVPPLPATDAPNTTITDHTTKHHSMIVTSVSSTLTTQKPTQSNTLSNNPTTHSDLTSVQSTLNSSPDSTIKPVTPTPTAMVLLTHTTNATVSVTPYTTATDSVPSNITATVPTQNSISAVLETHMSTATVLKSHTTIITAPKIEKSASTPKYQETTATTTDKISTPNSPTVNGGGTSQDRTSEISHPTDQVPKTNVQQPKQFNRTVAANRDGDKHEQVCSQLMEILNLTGNCRMTELEINGVYKYKSVLLLLADPSNDTISPANSTPKEKQTEDTQMTSIAIAASCGALALILLAFAVYCSYHRLSYRKNQQHLTEELQTVENGYHDNPTLEVMEVQPETQEKKLALNGEFNDSWMVPFDNLCNLVKDDIPDEEDTHL